MPRQEAARASDDPRLFLHRGDAPQEMAIEDEETSQTWWLVHEDLFGERGQVDKAWCSATSDTLKGSRFLHDYYIIHEVFLRRQK